MYGVSAYVNSCTNLLWSVIELKSKPERTSDVQTQIKDPDLVEKRRRQIVDAAVGLFVANGFHKTTTRQIASAVGFSIGSLYEYVASKEDVLYLVCDAIHAEVERGVSGILSRDSIGREAVAEVIREYCLVCNRMREHVLLMYKVTQFLPNQWKKRVLENELRITELFVKTLTRVAASEAGSDLSESKIELLAHNIAVLGQAWAFRSWAYSRNHDIEEYIAFQTDFILNTVF